MAHQSAVRRLFQEAIESGRMTEQQLQTCLDHADGTPWGELDHSKQSEWHSTNVDVVWQTYDYNAFRIVPGLNRDVDHWKRIVASMAKADLMSPIIVNEAMEIIDGQNRFFARRYLGLPILYIEQQGYGPDEMRLYNNDSKNWTKADFIQSYSSEGREPYELLQQLYINFPRLSKPVIDQAAFGGHGTASAAKIIAAGQLNGIDFEACTKTLKCLMAYAGFPNALNPARDILQSPGWCRAWLTLVQKNPDTNVITFTFEGNRQSNLRDAGQALQQARPHAHAPEVLTRPRRSRAWLHLRVPAAAVLGCYTHSHIHVSVSHEKQTTMPVLSSSSSWL